MRFVKYGREYNVGGGEPLWIFASSLDTRCIQDYFWYITYNIIRIKYARSMKHWKCTRNRFFFFFMKF